MKTTILGLGALLLSCASGCGAAVRSPEAYSSDTRKVLEAKNQEIRACYDGVLKSTPTAGGRVTVHFDVEIETGKIANVKVDSAKTTAPEEISSCVTRSIPGLVLAPADGNTGEATWTYEFAVGGVTQTKG